MQFSEAWLRDWVDPGVPVGELADALSMAGLEVDGVEPAAPEFSGVVVGEVRVCERHPDADKLSVCQVDLGDGDPVQIVCGAKNVAGGMKVPVAKVGAVLPGGFEIKKAKLRGVLSHGMICSAAELGLADSSDGIMPLPADAPVGEDFRAYLQLDDHIIDVDLTPDRGDCLSIAGIAREVGVIFRKPVTDWEIRPVAAAVERRVEVTLEAPDACPRYACRVVEGIDPGAETPLWMQERLRRSGIRSIHPVVDVTNFVMLELGQPMHGFDLDRLSGGIHVRLANEGERLTLLDGNEAALRSDTLVIADETGPLALAGIMGGVDSGVTEATRNVLLEAAFFQPTAILGRPRAYGLHTDSSHRFERGVDPELAASALERATDLLISIAGGRPGPVVDVQDDRHLPRPPRVTLRRTRVARLLGVEVADAQIEEILQRLGMEVTPVAGGWSVVPPSARFDIAIEADLVEEVGRIYGYARIPENLSSMPVSVQAKPEGAFRLARARARLVDLGFQEVITYSFIRPDLARRLSPQVEPLRLANPISEEMSVMRTSLWPGLLETLRSNLARQQERARLFESGQVFLRDGDEILQPARLGGLMYGPHVPEQWAEKGRPTDFYDLKGVVESLLALVDQPAAFEYRPVEDPALHPGQAAVVLRDGVEVGRLGQLHPALQKTLEVPGEVWLFELRLDALDRGRVPGFQPLSRFPFIRRDLALLIPKSVTWAEVERCARAAAPEIVREIRVFDLYTGKNIDPDLKSLALSLILQDYSHTLTDEETERAVASVREALERELSAKLRD